MTRHLMTRHSAIFTNLLLTLPLVAGLLGAAANASAQTAERATIPFAFTANHLQIPAGNYEVRILSNGLLSLRNVETGKAEFLMIRRDEDRSVDTRSRLVFQRDETASHLTQVWIAGTSYHSELAFQPKPGQLMAKNSPVATFEIALK